MLVIFALRASRWQALFSDSLRPKFLPSFLALMLGYLFNNLLPARAGELVRVHVIGRRGQIPRSAALGTVVVERTLELLVMLALLSFVLIKQPLPGWTEDAGKVVVALALGAIIGLVCLGLLGEKIIESLVRRLVFLPVLITRRLVTSGKTFIGGVSAVLNAQHVAGFLTFTAFIWLLEISVAWAISSAFNLQLSPLHLLFVLIAIAIGTMVPASPGYVGTFEFFGLSALALIGVSGSGALGFVVVLHAVLLLGSSMVGAACLAYMGWPRFEEVNETIDEVIR